MLLSELEALTYTLLRQPARKKDPDHIRLLLNLGGREFVKATGVLRYREQVTITDGFGKLRSVPDNLNLAGRIIRVEDAATGANRALAQTDEQKLDVLVGLNWRLNTEGTLTKWYRGTPNEGLQDGFATIGVYPVVASGTVNVFYVKMPLDLKDDSTPDDVPEQFQMARVWYAVILLADDEKVLALAKESWGAEVARAQGETSTWQIKMGAA